jgi:outer membrane protein OmpA-like peptidoglycan-associated protein
MAASIIDTLTRSLEPSTLSKAGAVYRESEEGLRKGFSAAIAAVLASLVSRAGDNQFMRHLLSMVHDVPADVTLLDDPERLFLRSAPQVEETGPIAALRSLVFGGNPQMINSAIAQASGVKPSTAATLFAVALPTVLGYLSRIVTRENLDAAGLGRRLASERDALTAALPSSLASLLTPLTPLTPAATADAGASSALSAARSEQSTFAAPAAASSAAGSRASTGTWLAAGLFTILALVALYALIGRSTPDTSGTPGAIGTAGYLSRSLPDGTHLRFPATSTEARLLAFLETNAPVDREIWYELDRITFETDSANLKPESREQLSNISAIMKAYPQVHAKIGGYTDNTGDPSANLRLSQSRAQTVRSELQNLGVDGSRLESEGYGNQHPVASNDIAEGRKQNRRVAIRVTER